MILFLGLNLQPQMKKTLVIGASEKPERYAYKATNMLKEYKHEVVAYGNRKGQIEGTPISTEWPSSNDFDTVTLYINAGIQADFEQKIMDLQPKRVVFNPGTENPGFEAKLAAAGIEPIEACTLVMLRTGQY